MKTHLRYLGFSIVMTLVTAFTCSVWAATVFPIATNSAIESGCKSAFDGSNYLVGVQGGPLAEGVITAQLISAGGTLVRTVTVLGESGGMPQLAFDGANYLMVWAGASTSPGFNGQFVSKSGDLVSPVLRISSGSPPTSTTATSLTYGGGRYLACWSDNSSIQGQLVNPDGTFFGPSFTISGSVQEPRENAIAFDGTNFFVVFNGGAGNLPNIYGQLVSSQGSLIGATVSIDNSPDPSDNPLAVSFDGTNYLVVFNDQVGGIDVGSFHVFGRLVSTSGAVSTTRFTIANNPGVQRFPFLAFDGSNYLVAWSDGADPASIDLVLRFFDRTGQPVGPEFSPFTPQGANRPMFGAPVFGSTNYLVTAVLVGFTNDQNIASANVYGTVVSPNPSPPVPFTYTTNNGAITITRYTGSGGDIIIPEMITGLPVVSIGSYAFYSCTNLTYVTIPNSVTSVGEFAFFSCGLHSVMIPINVTNIGVGAFSGCTRLTAITVDTDNPAFSSSVDGVLFDKPQTTLVQYPGGGGSSYAIPNSVKAIGDYAFQLCTSLTDFVIGNNVASIGAGAFSRCYSLTNVVIGNSVTNIGSYAFEVCDNLIGVTIPSSVTNIEDGVFYRCSNLTSITIPSSVTSIGSSAFAYCANLTGVYFQGSAPAAGSDVFYEANNATVYYPLGASGWGTTFCGRPTVPSSPPLPFTWTTNNGALTITKYTGPGGSVNIPGFITGLPVTSIGYDAFGYCRDLTTVTIPNGVTNLGAWAFLYCTSLTNITIPNGVIGIGVGAFSGCGSLTSVTIPESVTSIGAVAFQNCGSLTEIIVDVLNSNYSSVAGVLFNKSQTALVLYPARKSGGDYPIPTSVTSVGFDAFRYSRNLTNVTIPNSVTNLGGLAFMYSGLTSITIPRSVSSIGDGAFKNCYDLREITVDGLNSYYSSAAGVLFDKSQTTLIYYPAGKGESDYSIPTSVTDIEIYAFNSCTSLTNVTIPNSITGIGGWAFAWCTSLTSVEIPNSVTHIGDGAFDNCTGLMDVTIGSSVVSIGTQAFSSCSSLTNVIIPNSVTNLAGWTFSYCYGLREITVDELNPYYRSVAGVLFDRSLKTLIQYPAAKGGSDYAIPSNVTRIADEAFGYCTNLTSVTIPNGVTSIGYGVFDSCTSLAAAYFQGNAPSTDGDMFNGDDKVTAYYLPGTTGWGPTFEGIPTSPWVLPYPVILTTVPTFGVQTNEFSFVISWATNASVVVEVCTNLTNLGWIPIRTNTFVDGSSYFNDPQWRNYPARFYRLRKQ